MGVSAPVKVGIHKGLQSHSGSSLYEDLGEENKAPMLVVQAQGGGGKRP